MALSRSRAPKWRTVGVGGAIISALVPKGKTQNCEALTCKLFLDVQSVNPMLKTSLVGVP